MNFDLSEEQQVLQRAVREFCAREIIPNAARWDREEHFPHEIIPAMGEMGLFGMQIPEAYGGAGMKFYGLRGRAGGNRARRRVGGPDHGVAQFPVHGAPVPGRQRGAASKVHPASGQRPGAGWRGG